MTQAQGPHFISDRDLMNVRRVLLVAAVAGAFAAPVYAERFAIDVETAPPAPRHEHMQPRKGYVVTPGYYRYDTDRQHHTWVKGHYQRERHGEHYVAPEWREHEGRYHFNEGHWERNDKGQ